MRTRAIVVVLGLAMVGAASIARAQVVPPLGVQCSPDQLGQTCENMYMTCSETVCFRIEDQLNDAGEDVGVPTSCNACTACVETGCLYTGCPAGSYCTGRDLHPASPWGGVGYGPASNPDETAIAVPQYTCVDAGPQDLTAPTCPNLGGVAESTGAVGPASSASSSGGPGAGTTPVVPVNDPPPEGTGSPSVPSAPSTESLDASVDPATASATAVHYEVLGHGACTMAPGNAAIAGKGALAPVGVALGLLAMRRRRKSGQA
jgi:hypothetical protein